jgi:hypothetical protein
MQALVAREGRRHQDQKLGRLRTASSSPGASPESLALSQPLRERHGFRVSVLQGAWQVPLSPAVFVADHLRKVAIWTGIKVPDGYRFGLHNLRHSLSNWMVNKAKVEPKTVQGILAQPDSDDARPLHPGRR